MEVLFNLHYPDVFAIANSNALFYQSLAENSNFSKNAFSPRLFLTKDSDVNADVKCMAWHPSPDCSEVIALGQSNGRVSLISTNFLRTTYARSFVAHDFVPKHAASKHCSGLSWNNTSPHLLAIGLEKSKSGSLIIWDINSKSDFIQSSDKGKASVDSNPSPNSQTTTKPFYEAAAGDSVNSLVWLTETNLVAGFNKRFIRVYDIRMSSSSNSVINHRSTFGLCIDPTHDTRFACFGDEIISVWDSRHFFKPVANVPLVATSSIQKIEWSCKRSGMLGALFSSVPENSRRKSVNSTVYVYDMLNATHTDQDQQVGGYQPIQRDLRLQIPEGDSIAGFAWAPHLRNNALLTVTNQMSFKLTDVPESTTVTWAGRDNFAIANGCHASVCTQEVKGSGDHEDTDMASLIYRRVLNGYGLSQDNILRNIDLSLQPNNQNLHSLWKFIDRIKKALALPLISKSQSTVQQSPSHLKKSYSLLSNSKPSVNAKKPLYFTGVQNVLKDDSENYGPTQIETIPWIGVDNTKSKVFTSEKRTQALMMCDWGRVDRNVSKEGNRFGRNSVGEDLVRRLQKSGATERACAVAVWHLDIKLAIEILNLSLKNKKSSEYSAVAMALSGYTGSNCPTLWLDTCRQLQNELEDAYLQMAFAFLIACSDESKNAVPASKFDTILSNHKICLEDRVAFACMYLPDIPLNTYINSLTEDLIIKGRLEGVAIVGLCTKSGIKLFQSYLNQTRDIQTPLLAIIHSLFHMPEPTVRAKDPQVQHWRDSYRNLLNKWKLYFERVELDLLWNKACSIRAACGQVYLHCNYCNKSVSHSLQPNYSKTQSTESFKTAEQKPVKSSSELSRQIKNPEKSSSESFQKIKGPDQSVTGSSPSLAREQLSPRHLMNKIISRSKRVPTSTAFGSPCRDVTRAASFPSPSHKATAVVTSKGRGYGGGANQQNTITSCPYCRKPLPRCSVCSMHLGTRQEETDFTKWITWCMKCRHGGHQGHLQEWFENHQRCPVTDCKCFCNDELPVS